MGHHITIRILGLPGAGKSTLFDGINNAPFSPNYVPTVKARRYDATWFSENESTPVTVWDPGAENGGDSQDPCGWRPSLQYDFRADGFLVCYDITNKEAFEQLQDKVSNLRMREVPDYGFPVSLILVATKCDLSSERQVQTKEAIAFAQKNGMDFCEISAATNYNVQAALETLISNLIEARKQGGVVCNKVEERQTKIIGAPLSKAQQVSEQRQLSEVHQAMARIWTYLEERKQKKPVFGIFGNPEQDYIDRENDWINNIYCRFFADNQKYWQPTEELIKQIDKSISTFSSGESNTGLKVWVSSTGYVDSLTALKNALLGTPTQNNNNNNHNRPGGRQ